MTTKDIERVRVLENELERIKYERDRYLMILHAEANSQLQSGYRLKKLD